MRRLLLAGALLGALVPAAARAQAPDRAFTTPVAREAQASASLSKTGLQKALAREMAKAPGASGAWVYDSANSEVVYKKRSATNRTPASNMKLLTTATAFGKFGGAGVLETQIWQVGHLDGSTLRGNL
ncbi:MAG: D-Ala-D-Ala carboxypeptidase 3 family, partial [Solirubrobacterales bacterium]|nr:D-Ala-D-Ala carboxypeptidase 3 family [Solirubrobacterales bacterium]